MWDNKPEALASYAKQAGDDSLRKMADRIQARAIRRQGELLRQIEPGKAGPKLGAVADTRLTRTELAQSAGLSKRQQVTATRVSNVPAESFERQVESDSPPTVTALASQGTKPLVRKVKAAMEACHQ